MQAAPDYCAVRVLVTMLGVEWGMRARCRVPCVDDALAILWMQRLAPAGADHLIGREPSELEKVGVAEDAVALGVDNEQAKWRGLADRAQPRLAFAQRTHALAPVGDIAQRAGDAVDPAQRIQGWIGEDLYPAGQSVAAQQARRVTRGVDLAAQQGLESFQMPLPVLGMDEVGDRPRERRPDRMPGQSAPLGIEADPVAVGVCPVGDLEFVDLTRDGPGLQNGIAIVPCACRSALPHAAAACRRASTRHPGDSTQRVSV